MQNIFKYFFFLLVACFVASCKQPTYQPTFAVCRSISEFPVIAAAGYDYVEASVSGFLVPGQNDSAFQVNLEQMKQLGAKVISCTSFIPGELKITGPETRHDEIIVWAETAFRRAQMANMPYIVLGSGGARRIPEGFDKQIATQQFIEVCKRMAPLAQKYDVVVVVEPLNKGETNFINSL